jgi:hypothetical protein
MKILLVMSVALNAGCGENTVIGTTSTATLESSQTCISCHGTVRSPVTGDLIADEWLRSRHKTVSALVSGASCSDCHEPAAGHPNSCSRCHGGTPTGTSTRHDVTANPDSALKCLKCHTEKTLGAPHFNNVTTGKFPASYVSSRYRGNCRKCHNPHDPTTALAAGKEWAESGHGDTAAPPWTNYDFKTRGTSSDSNATPANSAPSDCVRCHTTTGYIKYVTSNFTDIHAWGTTSDSKTLGKEVLGCDGCHDDGNGNAYGFKRRTVAPVTGYYNYSTPVTGKLFVSFNFPDVTTSNICMACHVGRQGGITIKAIETVESTTGRFRIFSSAGGMSFINSHYLTAGATIFKASGYEYAGRSYDNPSYYKHSQIGVNDVNGTGRNGPCVTCHMNTDKKHLFLPVSKNETDGSILAITSKTCSKCHDDRNPMTVATLQGEKDGFNAALAVLAEALKVRGFTFNNNNPYFTNKNWQTTKTSMGGYGAGTGGKTMGAAFNFNLLRHDYGAFAHNRLYAKRLIYDSIDWIDDGQLNMSVESSLGNPAKIPDDPALLYTVDGSLSKFDAAVKAKALAYLQGSSANPSGTGGSRP